MAILPLSAELIATIVFDQGIRGRCLELARQDVRLTLEQMERILKHLGMSEPRRLDRTQAALERLARIEVESVNSDTRHLTDRQFFRVLGFDEALSVDASGFEGADYIHDLNSPGLVQKLSAPVHFAVETGTAEHVFHLPQYLQNVCECLAIGGVALHFVPAHNYLDHGFYQFSPTLFLDFYLANRFELLDLLLIETSTDDWSTCNIRRYQPGEFDRRDKSRFPDRYVMLAVAARKQADSTSTAIPQQRIYSTNASWREECLNELIVRSVEVATLAGPHVRDSGHCWQTPVPREAGPSDSVEVPSRSTLILLENGRPLGPAHSAHDDIRSSGSGRFSHWGDFLYFSTSDNTNPETNGRVYTLRTSTDIVGVFALDVVSANADGKDPRPGTVKRSGLGNTLLRWLGVTGR